jgi:hypothetical protein
MGILQSRPFGQVGRILLGFLAAIPNLDLHYPTDLLRRRDLALPFETDLYD